jgi:predicted enzyme related to lactoylglutathione lyase
MATESENPAIINGSTFVWHEINAPSITKSIEFYTQALDFGTLEFDMGEMGTYHMLTRHGQGVAGVIQPQQAGIPAHWATYISVDDVDARVEKCRQFGATLIGGPFDVPTIGRMALIADPQGATVWIFKPMPRQ